ncbi:hypothetical protein JTB14_031229 [Gonioctena quinquepunctata]|nr:hypothetical protein JTB14_031229 [Gonioctena quinquepunctata]
MQEEEDEVRDIENFIDIINNRCGVEFKFHDLRDWYRIGESRQNTGRPRPIVVELIFYKQRVYSRKASKLKGSGIYISKDYIREDYNSRKILFTHLKTARNSDPEAKIWKNKLIVHGLAIQRNNWKITLTKSPNTWSNNKRTKSGKSTEYERERANQ